MGSRTAEILRREKMDMSLPVLIDLFAATKQIEGRTPKTVSWYRNMLGRFAVYLGEHATVKQITLDNARSFIAYLQAKKTRYEGHPFIPAQEGGLSPHTILCYVRALEAFGSWLEEERFTTRCLAPDGLGQMPLWSYYSFSR